MTHQENLKYFFGRYLHQNWLEFYSTVQEAVGDFLKNSTPEVAKEILSSLDWLVNQRTDEEKYESLLEKFYCAYDPRSEGKTYKQWVTEVYNQIAEHIGKATLVYQKAQPVPVTSQPPSSEYDGASSGSYPDSDSSNSNIGEVFGYTSLALLLGVILYPVIGLGGCITRILVQGPPPNPMAQPQASDIWINSPVKSWTHEAIIIPLLIVAITFFVGLIKNRHANPAILILLFLSGVVGVIYIGSGVINFTKTDATSSPAINNPSQAGAVGTMREVNTLNLNMRSGPGGNSSVVATFPKKSRIVSFGETRTVDGELWTQASTPDGRTRGWVNRKFLTP